MTTDQVLSQPTRARIFELLEESGGPTATAELAERLNLHPNGVRTHLERMRDAGLIERRRRSEGRGRPRDEWMLSPTARPRGLAPTAYVDLVRWLARAYPAGPQGLRQIDEVGREVGREVGKKAMARPEAPGPAEALLSTFTALGFQPESVSEDEASFTCRLGNCPYREAVRENQPVVCGLHRGMTVGLLEAIDPRVELEEFLPKDPEEAGCLVRVGAKAG